MTLLVITSILKTYYLDPSAIYISTRNNVLDITEIKGTTAELPNDHLITIKDLIYGMMLPSGNDAASLLALFFGELLQRSRNYIVKVLANGGVW